MNRTLFFIFFLASSFLYAKCGSGFGQSKCKVSINDVNMTEYNTSDGDHNLTFTISMNDTSDDDIKIDFNTTEMGSGDTYATKDDDYKNVDTTTFTIPSGKKSIEVNVTIYADDKYENNESFWGKIKVNSDSDDDAEIDDGDGNATIINDDPKEDTLSVIDKKVSESDGDITVTIKANGGAGANKDLDVNWSLEEGSAKADEDYDDDSGKVHFDKGDTEKNITIHIKDDNDAEDAEQFKVHLHDSNAEHLVDGNVTIRESDKIVIRGDKYDSPEVREDLGPMKIYVGLVDPNEKAYQDLKLHIKTDEDTATAGDDYDDIDKDITIKKGDNSVEVNVTVNDDDEEEDNEDFNITISANDIGNAEIKEDKDTGTIIDNDQEETLSNGEYNDTDNYYLRDGSGDKKYKRLFCTPLNVWDNDDTAKIRVETNDANITQILEGQDENISYYRLYAKNIEVTSDGDPGEVCKEGTHKCETENLARLGDNMEVNDSWFDYDENEQDMPKCDAGGSVSISNVDSDGNIITWKAREYDSCEVNFTNKDYSKPFIIRGKFKMAKDSMGDDNQTMNMDPGFYFFQEVELDNQIYVHVNTGQLWKQDSSIEHNITRMYVKYVDTGDNKDGAYQGYVFPAGAEVNWIHDCNNDGKEDDKDAFCQKPSQFLLWTYGVGADDDDKLDYIVKEKGRYAMYLYNAGGYIGDGAAQSRVVFDTDGDVKYFVGGVSAYRIDLDPDTAPRVIWAKPDPAMKLFLGDGDKCIYTPSVYIKSKNQSFKETQGGDADINFSVEYFTPGTRQAMCENDWNISFDYNITQRYTDDKDKDGNATQDVDYTADKYSGTMVIAKQCGNCQKKKCWPPLSRSIDEDGNDFQVKEDKEKEPNELFDLNLSNLQNAKFEDTDVDHITYIMTIIDVPPPKTLTGAYDAYDVSKSDQENDQDGKIEFDDGEDRNISTKIVNEDFKLTFGTFDQQNANELSVHKDDDGNVIKIKYGLISCPDANTTDVSDCDILTQSDEIAFDENELNFSFNIDKAVKYAAAYVRVCTEEDDDGNITLYQYDDCDGNTKCKDDDGNNQKCLRDVMSTDKFAIRPYSFRIFGKNEYKKAGEDFNLTIKAVDKDNNDKDSGDVSDVDGVSGYDENASKLDYKVVYYYPTDDETKTMNKDVYGKDDTNRTRVAHCEDGTLDKDDDKNFSNGEVNLTFNYDETGVYEINVSEVNGSEFAEVDEDDTPDEDRFIKPSKIIYDKDDISKTDLILSLPYSMKTEAKYKTINGANWTYMRNLTASDYSNNIVAYLDFTMTAYNKNGDVVKNFDKHCFPDFTSNAPTKNGLKINSTFDFLPFAKIVANNKDFNMTAFEEDNESNPISVQTPHIQYDSNDTIEGWVPSWIVDKGVAKIRIYFNVDRNKTIPVNPIELNVTDVNVTTTWEPPTKFDKSSIDKIIEFRYGFFAYKKDLIGYGKTIDTQENYEYYKDDHFVLNTDHNETFGDILSFKNDKVDVTKGDIDPVGREPVTYSYDGARPYSELIHIDIPAYLWYGNNVDAYKAPSDDNEDCKTHPCQKVTFYSASKGWGGVGNGNSKFSENNNTSNVGAFKDANGSKQDFKRVMW